MRRAFVRAMAGAVAVSLGFGLGLWASHKWDGYVTEYGDWTSNSCEHDAAGNAEFPDGVERFLLYTGPDFERVCKHQGYISDYDCHAVETGAHFSMNGDTQDWAGKTVNIDYKKQHRVCVHNMPIHETRCFDLYDIGER